MTRLFERPKKTATTFKRVVGATTSEAQIAVHPTTRERDAQNLSEVQKNRALKPPTKLRLTNGR